MPSKHSDLFPAHVFPERKGFPKPDWTAIVRILKVLKVEFFNLLTLRPVTLSPRGMWKIIVDDLRIKSLPALFTTGRGRKELRQYIRENYDFLDSIPDEEIDRRYSAIRNDANTWNLVVRVQRFAQKGPLDPKLEKSVLKQFDAWITDEENEENIWYQEIKSFRLLTPQEIEKPVKTQARSLGVADFRAVAERAGEDLRKRSEEAKNNPVLQDISMRLSQSLVPLDPVHEPKRIALIDAWLADAKNRQSAWYHSIKEFRKQERDAEDEAAYKRLTGRELMRPLDGGDTHLVYRSNE
ncbi:hypothetical protein ACFSSA_13485 [Luteolibacter algae]|uniref:Uncharacterized protein n=1 Tax=Luteolibacter algae TaxID=454151 RepID=A0ABW5DAQ9_9BACT